MLTSLGPPVNEREPSTLSHFLAPFKSSVLGKPAIAGNFSGQWRMRDTDEIHTVNLGCLFWLGL